MTWTLNIQELDVLMSIINTSWLVVYWISTWVFWLIILIAFNWGSIKEKLKSVDKVDWNLNSITKNISKMEWILDLIQKRIDKIDWLTQSNSPISLTEKWEKIAKESNVEQFIANKWSQTKNSIQNECKNKNPYDIQEFLFDFIRSNLEEIVGKSWVEKLKLIAYNEWVDIYSISRVIAVIIRDKYFQEKNIDTKEVDKCDPNFSLV